MKAIIQDTNNYILRFNKGEDAFEKLLEFCSTQNIQAAWLNGIGAAEEVILSYYDLPTKSYKDKTFHQEVEVVGIMGNIAMLSEKTVFHCHGTIADEKYQTFGGHIKKIIVSATLEIYLSVFNGKISRGLDNATGLNLMQ